MACRGMRTAGLLAATARHALDYQIDHALAILRDIL